jgi:hypothetical protein
MTIAEWRKLVEITESTNRTSNQLALLNGKMNKQIALLEQIVKSLERREDDGK